ncbi:MAG: hypothetical protein HUU35_04305, partial [Armatimonadetes bacterium]|nr:hypothetical protein [Armatimonadota bacterium]
MQNLLWLLLAVTLAPAAEVLVRDVAGFRAAVEAARPADVIVLADGTWRDAELLLRGRGTAEQPITLRAQTPGKVILNGASSLRFAGSWLVADGLCFRDGQPPRGSAVVEFRGDSKSPADHCRLTNSAIINVNPPDRETESKWVSLYGEDNRVDHCYLAGKTNLGTTLVVWLAPQPNRHRIDHNHFGERPRLKVNGGETIRVGTSDWSMHDSQTVVESNWFEGCNGEVEIISSKSCGNLYRANTFYRCEGALTLRHGNRCRVEGNAFLGDGARYTGGVRVIGEDQVVVNNLFAGLQGDGSRAALSLMQGIPNSPLSGYFQVKRAVIAHNTLVDCASSVEVGLRGTNTSLPPEDCLFANNVIRAAGSYEVNGIHAKGNTGVYFNSCLVRSTHPASAALQAEMGAIDIRNNQLVNTGGGYALAVQVGAGAIADYNNLYATGSHLAINMTTEIAYPDINTWQAATGLDIHSLSVHPLFVSNEDLHTRQAALDGAGIPVAGVVDDFDGDPRDAGHPDIGADEFSPGGSDLSVESILSPVSGCTGGSAELVSMLVANRGGSAQTGFTVFYQLNNQPPVSENVGVFALEPGAVLPYSFAASADLSAQGNFNLRVWVQAAADDNPSNDTATAALSFADFNLDITVSKDAVCKGGSVTLIATAVSGASYLWSNGSIGNYLSAHPTIDQTYWVTVTRNACQHIDSAHIVVWPLPQQVEIIPDGPTTFCPGGSVTLQANVPDSIQWNTGATSPSILVSQTGTYFVTLTNSFGCTTYDQVNVTNWPTQITGEANICPGEQAVLTLPYPLLSGQWSTGESTQSIT